MPLLAYLFPDITVLKVRFVLQNFKKSFKGNFCLSLFNFQGASHLIPMIFIIFRFRRSSVPQVSFAIISNPSPFVNPIFSSFLSFLLPFFNTPGCCFCPLVFSCLFSSFPLLYILRWGGVGHYMSRLRLAWIFLFALFLFQLYFF